MWSRALVLVVSFGGLTFLFALPLSLHPGSTALDLGPDTRLFLWTLGWDIHALAERPLSIFDANIFYPENGTLAYSEHQIGSALAAAPILALGGDLLLAMNLVALLSCALSGLGAYLLARELGVGTLGAVVAGVVFAFTPPRFFRLGQLHLATVQWIPLCLAFLHRYARGGTLGHLVAAVSFFTLQALSGGQSGLFLAMSAAALGLYLLVTGEIRPRTESVVRDVGVALVLVLALNVPFLLPYLKVQRELGLERSLQEARAWSPNVASFLATPSHADRLALRTVGWESWVLRDAKAYLFPGWLPLALVLVALWGPKRSTRVAKGPVIDVVIVSLLIAAGLIEAAGGIRIGGVSASGGGRALGLAFVLFALRLAIYRRAPFAEGYWTAFKSWARDRMGVPAAFYVFVGVFSLWASLGPAGGLYAALHRLVPGFDFIRVPSRLTILTVVAVAVLAGFGAERIVAIARGPRRFSFGGALGGEAPILNVSDDDEGSDAVGRLGHLRPAEATSARSRVVGAALVAVILAELAAFPLATTPYRVETSPMDAWIAEHDDSDPIAAFPIPDPSDEIASARRHSSYMLDSLAHFAPLVNGYSGFTPPSHTELFRRLGRFPDEDGLARLEDLGVRWAVFHRHGYDDGAWDRFVARAETLSERLRLVASFDEGRVYEITRRRRR